MEAVKLNIAVLFDGGGLARLGLEQAGHTCTGYELDPAKHYLSKMVGSGNTVIADVFDITPDDLQEYDAIWVSSPCQSRSGAGNPHMSISKIEREYNDRLLEYSIHLAKSKPIHWIENGVWMTFVWQCERCKHEWSE